MLRSLGAAIRAHISCKPTNISQGRPTCQPISSQNSRSPTRTPWSPTGRRSPPRSSKYGGRFLTRGGATELIEGGPEPKRIVILEFADTAAVKRWYNSPEYQKILPMRLDNSTGRAFVVEGVS